MPFMALAPDCIAFIVSRLIFAFSKANTCASIVFFVFVHLSSSFSSCFFRDKAAKAAIKPSSATARIITQNTNRGIFRYIPFLFEVAFFFAVAV